jgi:SH3 domain protein
VYKIIITSILFFISTSVFAESTQYVTDHIVITMRKGQGAEFQILRTLSSGTPLAVVESIKKSGYSRVRTKDGLEGWVLTQYLSDKPASKDLLDATEQKLAKLEAENKQLKEKASKLLVKNQQLEAEWNSLVGEDGQVVEASNQKDFGLQHTANNNHSNFVNTKALVVKRQIDMLRQENQALKDRSNKDWFLLGASIFFAGLLAGIVLPMLRNSKKSSWGEL